MAKNKDKEKKGAVNWVAELRQLLPSDDPRKPNAIGLRLPNLEEIDELMEQFPKHRRKLRSLIQKDVVTRHTVEVEENKLAKLIKMMKRFQTS